MLVMFMRHCAVVLLDLFGKTTHLTGTTQKDRDTQTQSYCKSETILYDRTFETIGAAVTQEQEQVSVNRDLVIRPLASLYHMLKYPWARH